MARLSDFSCGRLAEAPSSRRQFLTQTSAGFGAVALSALLAEWGFADTSSVVKSPHFKGKAKQVIFLYMDGGPSQVDTFDPKPRLDKDHGKPFAMRMEPTQFNNNGTTLRSPWKFKQAGQSGHWISELFPHLSKCADELAVVRSMVSNFSEHTSANYFLHSGSGLQGRPSAGAWTVYGLGNESKSLPGYIVLDGGLIPPGGVDVFGSGFLSASYQGSLFRMNSPQPIMNLTHAEKSAKIRERKLSLVRSFDRQYKDRIGSDDQIESAISNFELACRMQTEVPDLLNLASESRATRQLYGIESSFPATQIYGKQCLLARRLIERGVRFIELTCPAVKGDRWDQHSDLKGGHERNSLAVDQPIAGLLSDLRSRGLLDETLILWAGEFGRTPFAQGSDGRDHNPFGFTIWMAGGGIKAGAQHGATDEFGYKVIDGKATIHDLHATLLHCLGFDHKKLTYRFGGRDMRLTDVHGELIKTVLA